MFGSHLSTAGGLSNALTLARELNLDCVQVFTKNQRQWKARPLNDNDQTKWRQTLKEVGWHTKKSGHRTVSHNSYLINMASPDKDLWAKSVATQRIEIERCEQLGIPLCVAHPGAHMAGARPVGEPNALGDAPTPDELSGLKRIIKALDQIHSDLPGYRTKTCLETTVGAGTALGYDFQHLQLIRENVKEPQRIGFCFDTCHVSAAGYDMSSDARATNVLRLFNRTCGYANLLVFHLNDSKKPIGSRKDRHEHIGHGCCGLSCFRAIVNHRSFRNVPKILETPKEEHSSGKPWDIVNIRRLKRLIRPT